MHACRQAGDSNVRLIMSLSLCLVSQALDNQLAGEQGSKLDMYEMEVANERGDALQDLAEFQLAAVSHSLTSPVKFSWTSALPGSVWAMNVVGCFWALGSTYG